MKGILDIEFRWFTKQVPNISHTPIPVLQYRKLSSSDGGEKIWTEWLDVPSMSFYD